HRRPGAGDDSDLRRGAHDTRLRGVVSCHLVSSDGGHGRRAMNSRLHLRFWLITFVVFCVLLYLLRGALLPFVAGMAIAYFLDPAADRLEKWGCSRTLATTIITLAFALVVVALIVLIVPLIQKQVTDLVQDLPQYVEDLKAA